MKFKSILGLKVFVPAIMCLVFFTTQANAAPAELIAQTLQVIGDGNFEVFGSFTNDQGGNLFPQIPQINDDGEILFHARVADTNTLGLWADSSNGPRRRVAINGVIPGYSAGVGFNNFTNAMFARNGDVVFRADVFGQNAPIGSGVGIYRSSPNSLVELMRPLWPAPQTANPQLYFHRSSLGTPFFSRTPTSETFNVAVSVTPNIELNPQDRGIWALGTSNPLRILEGYPAPGISNTTIASAPLEIVNNFGPAVYKANLTGSGVQTLTFGSATVINDVAIWADTGEATPTLIARKGQIIPQTNPSQVISGFGSVNYYPKSYGAEDGSVIFGATIINAVTGASMGEGLWRAHNGSFEQIFRTGQAIANAPGIAADYVVSHATIPTVLDCDGTATYIGNVAGSGITYQNSTSIIQETPAGPIIVARGRQQAPGTPDGVLFNQSSLVGKIVCGNEGRFAFSAFVQGAGVTSGNNNGIWYSENGQAQLVARKGMQIGGFYISQLPGVDNLAMADDGRIIFHAQLIPVNFFSPTYYAVMAWSPCGGLSILVSTIGQQQLEIIGGSPIAVTNITPPDANSMNSSGDVALVVWHLLEGQSHTLHSIVKIPFPICSAACPADFDGNGPAEVADIFAFLSAWFAQSSSADFNDNGGIAVDDIFAFLSAWFAGC